MPVDYIQVSDLRESRGLRVRVPPVVQNFCYVVVSNFSKILKTTGTTYYKMTILEETSIQIYIIEKYSHN